MSKKSTQKQPTVITLTLPENEGATHSGTLLVQRGDLARLHQFTYTRIADLSENIADALNAFATVEANPPVVSELSSPKPQPRQQLQQQRFVLRRDVQQRGDVPLGDHHDVHRICRAGVPKRQYVGRLVYPLTGVLPLNTSSQ